VRRTITAIAGSRWGHDLELLRFVIHGQPFVSRNAVSLMLTVRMSMFGNLETGADIQPLMELRCDHTHSLGTSLVVQVQQSVQCVCVCVCVSVLDNNLD